VVSLVIAISQLVVGFGQRFASARRQRNQMIRR
jgi:hypothetical protein